MNAPTGLGKYQLIRRLGKSMTEVYLAMDTVENRKAALKLIPLSGDRQSCLMIEAERRGAAIQQELHRMDPRVIEIYECGELDGYFFVAMEFVEGRTVADVLAADHIFDPCRAAVIAIELCEQLGKFHGRETAVVHGDIKPSNIHLGFSDTVRFLDFGIAKTVRPDGSPTVDHFGSPGYCSPERLRRSEVDPHADLWALGATLYEMLAGKPPYQAEDTRKLEKLIQSKRPPRSLPASCPSGLRAVVAKALAPEIGKRYASAGDLQADLQLFLEGRPTCAETERRSRWNPTATIEAARQAILRVTRTARRGRRKDGWLQAASAAAYFSTGLLLWIGGTFAWQTWQARADAAARPTLTPPPAESLSQFYLACADRILLDFRNSPSPGLYEFDWPKAEVCLERAMQLGAGGDAATGKLALVRGYATLERLNGAQYSDAAAGLLRTRIRDEFAMASLKSPADPMPHLALARVYAYSLPDPEKAMTEFAAAERLGAVLGRREVEQQGDAYRLRAQREFPRDWRQAMRDANVARRFYRRIPGFDEAEVHLRELDLIRQPAPRKLVARRYRGWR
jgi:hypothetical protein